MSHLDLNEYRKREKEKPQVVIGELKKMIGRLQAENKKLQDVLNLILNENFSGQSTLSPYAKRQADQALQKKGE